MKERKERAFYIPPVFRHLRSVGAGARGRSLAAKRADNAGFVASSLRSSRDWGHGALGNSGLLCELAAKS